MLGQTARCPPPPTGGMVNKTMQLVRSLAGTRLRFASLRSVWSLLAHYATLDREPAALLRSQARSSAPCTLSRYFGAVKPSKENYPLPHPPPARACPFTTLAFARDVLGQTARCPPPHPRGACKINKYQRKKKKITSRAPRPGGWGPGPPSPPVLVARLALVSPLILL